MGTDLVVFSTIRSVPVVFRQIRAMLKKNAGWDYQPAELEMFIIFSLQPWPVRRS